MKYKNLFSRGKIGNLELKNRIVMTAMGSALASLSGEVTDDMIQYFEERAKGGAGLVITEVTSVDEVYGRNSLSQLMATSSRHALGLEKLARAVHKHDTKIFVQLNHPGREGHAAVNSGKEIVAPSPVLCKSVGEMPRELTLQEIKDLEQKFIMGAEIVKTAGIDGVELHGAHGYLLNQFLSPYTNLRTDEYGGSFENRARILINIIAGIKEKCGKGFPVAVRLSVDEFVAGGIDLDLGVRISKYMEDAGADVIDVSCGNFDATYTTIEPSSYPQGWKKHLSKAVKDAVNIPVIAVNTIKKPDFAESLIADGITDFVGLGRGHLADPEWGKKAMEGRDMEITPCLSCRFCRDELGKGRSTKCTVNPRMGREIEFDGFIKNGDGRRVAIIGGGPAGLEAARVLAIKGFKPTLFELEDKLGGSLNLANKPSHKEKIDWLIDYFTYQMKILDVDVRLNTKATVQMVKELSPYAVYIAAGADPAIPNIEGINSEYVYTAAEILRKGMDFTGKDIIVVGGGMTGLETAELAAEHGNKVSVVEMLPGMGAEIEVINRLDLLGRLSTLNVELLTSHSLKGISSNQVMLYDINGDSQVVRHADIVILALGVKPRKNVVDEFRDNFENVKVIGDAERSGKISEAVREGFEKAYVL